MKSRSPMPDLKRRARQLVVKILYEMEVGGLDVKEAREKLAGMCKVTEMREFALTLLDETTGHMEELDRIILDVAENWHPSRMAVIDRNVLRLGAAEILYLDDVPEKVAINEAIEIAKRFSTENSGRFVNGILDRVAKIKGEVRNNL
jgi:N utilization substance protein B